jgi:hypothetical protein
MAPKRKRVKCRRPKAASDRRSAKRVLEATPPALAVAPEEGAGSGGVLGGTAARAEPDGESAREPTTGTGEVGRVGDVRKAGPGAEAAAPAWLTPAG